MKLVSYRKLDAKEMNAKYVYFELQSFDSGEVKVFKTFGRAYLSASARARKGEDVGVFGIAHDTYWYREMLCCC